jgi:molecular chaperone DnaK (HSP70)
VKDIMLIDVTPLTLGVETEGGVFSEVLPRGSAVPWQAREGMPMGRAEICWIYQQNARDETG